MPGQHPKNLSDYLPVLSDQGIPNVLATPSPGMGFQVARFTMASAPDDFVFADNLDVNGNVMSNMADANYEVIPHNQTDVADESLISAKTTTQFTITGADTSDVVTLIIAGRLANQLG